MNVAARPFAPILITLMVESITLRNFKGYSDCKIENLRRINLVVGDNGSGKTALLEALFLAAGATPELVLRARQWRGLEGAFSGSQDAVSEAIWADIFHLFRTNKSAYVGLKGKGEENRSVTVIMNAPGSIRVIPPPRDQSAKTPKQQSDLPPIEFKYEVQGLGIRTVVPSFTENGIRFNELPRSYVRSAFYAANQTAPGSEMASNFSTLSKRFDSARFSTLLHDLFPDIKNPSIEISAGQPLLFVTATGIPKRMPIGLASGGSNKLAAILLSIAVMEGGLVIVDEIENGSHN